MKNIKLTPSNVEFSVENSTTILDAALKSNISLSHSCKTGSCGSCRAVVLKGEVESQDPHNILLPQENDEGVILTCCSTAVTDCQIQAEYFPELNDIKRKTVPAKISDLHFPTKDVAVIKFRLPQTAQFKYLSGQYLNLSFGGVTRSYSIANKCAANDGIELHIRKVSGGDMSEKVFSEMTKNTLVRLNGPIGTFFIRDSARPTIFLAGGTGFAPVKAMAEQLIAKKGKHPLHIYWGSSNQAGFYSELPKQWSIGNSGISYVPVVSERDPAWQGRSGFVHHAVLEDFADMQGFDVYACGSPLMIDAAHKDFIERGLPENQFYSDAFVASNN